MAADVRLWWVQKNRTKKARGRRVGDVLGVLARGPQLSVSDAPQVAASVVGRLVDQEFMSHCRIASLSGGTMVINVDEAALVYAMRMRWLDTLRSALPIRGTQPVVTGVVFRYGKTGVAISDSLRSHS